MQQAFPALMYNLCFDMFSVVRCWHPEGYRGQLRGRLFEKLFYGYCERKHLPLKERAGSRTLDGAYSASGFLHESDGVIRTPEIIVHLELKHLTQPVSKNDLVAFNQKGLDFITSEDFALKRCPLYRVLVSGSELTWNAKVFAAQWGILIIEPPSLPLLMLHDFARGLIPDLNDRLLPYRTEILKQVPFFVVSVQERLRRIASILDSGEPVLGLQRVERMLRRIQNEVGRRCWSLMDDLEPNWIEDRYDSLFLGDPGKVSKNMRIISRPIRDPSQSQAEHG